MEDQGLFEIFDDGFIEPKQEEKTQLIADLQSGNFHLSFSALSAFAISPRSFIAYKLQEKKTTKAMTLGQAVHCLVLEPDAFKDRFFVAPDVNGATKEGKATWHKIYCDFVDDVPADEFKMKIDDIIEAVRQKNGTIVLAGKVNEDAKNRARALTKNRACRYVLDQITQTEMFLPNDFQIAGVRFKGAIDGKGTGVIADIKNMPDATLDKAIGSIWSRRLHWQAFAYDSAFGGGHNCHILCVDGFGETSAHCFSEIHLHRAESQIKKYIQHFKGAVFESIYDPSIWDMSQDFWLRSDMNTEGINFL